MRHITTTFATYHESDVEAGEPSETGFTDEEGESMEPDEGDDPCTSAIDKAVDFLNEKFVHASNSAFNPGTFYTENECNHDRAYFEKGEQTIHSFHLNGFSEDEQEQIFNEVTP